MQRWKHLRLAGMLLALLAMLISRSAEAFPAQSKHCGGWTIVASPNPGNFDNILDGVAAISSSNVWAVGGDNNNGSLGQTLVEHWDGTQWSVVPSPSVGTYFNALRSVSAVSATDIWAVGYDEQGAGTPYQTLIEHWDGTQWSIVPSPDPGHAINRLYGVSAVSSTDVWAVGVANAAGPLVEHWDGMRWKVSHATRNGDFFGAVTALSTSDVWAVGRSSQSTTFIERWNGHRWHIVSSPGIGNGFLWGVAASSPKDLWAVGLYENYSSLNATLTEHWDGKRWQVVPSPNMAVANGGIVFENYLNGVAVASSHQVWAVGYYQPRGAFTANTLIEYYC